MAILKSTTTLDGVNHSDSYWNIEKIEIKKNGNNYNFLILLRAWHNQTMRNQHKTLITRATAELLNIEIENSDNLYALLYPLIMALPEWAGSTEI